MEAKVKTDKILKSAEFMLDEGFIIQYRGKQPKWKLDEYKIFKRVYAGYLEDEDRLEEFWETLQRVVEGCFLDQKKNCLKLGMPWNEFEAQKSAQIMFHTMWELKFLETVCYLLKFSENLLRISKSLKKRILPEKRDKNLKK